MDNVSQKLGQPLLIARLDGGYRSFDILIALVERGPIIMACRYDWVLAQGVSLKEGNWLFEDEMTRFYDLEDTQVVSTCPHRFRVVLHQTPFPGSRRPRKLVRYGLLENLAFSLSPKGLLKAIMVDKPLI